MGGCIFRGENWINVVANVVYCNFKIVQKTFSTAPSLSKEVSLCVAASCGSMEKVNYFILYL